MRKLDKILFVADGGADEQAALAQAMLLAQSNDARLITIMDVCARRTGPDASAIPARDLPEADARYRIAQAPVLKAIEGSSRVRFVANQTLEQAIEASREHDLVVKPAEKTRKLRSLLLGQDVTLMNRCECPVWIVKGVRDPRIRRILAAVELSLSKGPSPLDQAILEHAATLGCKENSAVHVVHAWRVPHEVELRGRMNVSSLLREMERAHRKQLDKLLCSYSFPRSSVHVLKGRSEQVIPELAKRLHADLVIASRSMSSGLRGAWAGSRLLSRLPCSLWTIRKGDEAELGHVFPPEQQTDRRPSLTGSAHA